MEYTISFKKSSEDIPCLSVPLEKLSNVLKVKEGRY